jgi:glutamyl-tRNA synthetase
MSEKTVRTRFAPSPTGALHLGGVRTALFSWLYARRHQGQFILRVEDTDQARSTPEAMALIIQGMAWLGLDHDEGPFYQSERFGRYEAVMQQLLDGGHAYRCYCSKERLEQLRESQQARQEKPRYDGCCRDLAPSQADDGRPYVIRFRNPAAGEVSFEDQIRGVITVSNAELDDLILARTDGVPTYNFTVVVDDWDMQITHVIRGADHINNTPRQINILNALGADVPHYAHVPMILGGDGKKLSKRHGAVSILQYRDQGYLPEALLNYLARLGWSHGDQELFSKEELIEFFDLAHVSKSPAAFSVEKLAWVNQHYLKTLDPALLIKPFSDQLHQLGMADDAGPSLASIIELQAERVKTLAEMAEQSRYFFEEFDDYDEKAARKHLKPEAAQGLLAMRDGLAALARWDKGEIHQVVIQVAELLSLKLGKLAQPVRVAVTGNTVSPSLDITLALIGRDRVLARLDRAMDWLGRQG